MDLGISGKKAIVCASSRGLGRGCALALAANGVDVVINGTNEANVMKTVEEIRAAHNVSVTPVIADVSTLEGQASLLAACPTPDILINNNGGPPRRDFREIDREAMLTGVTQNMVTPIELIQQVIDHMCDQNFGRIVNITSVSVKRPVFGLDLSSGARAGLTAFLAGVSRSVADKNVTINNLLPGYINTDRLRGGLTYAASVQNTSEEAVAAEQMAEVPAGRFGDPEAFGETAAFLCSVPAGYITGQNLLFDGGLFNGAF